MNDSKALTDVGVIWLPDYPHGSWLRLFWAAKPFAPVPDSYENSFFVTEDLMKQRLTLLLLLWSVSLMVGCANLSNMMTFSGVSEIPTLTEPDLDDE